MGHGTAGCRGEGEGAGLPRIAPASRGLRTPCLPTRSFLWCVKGAEGACCLEVGRSFGAFLSPGMYPTRDPLSHHVLHPPPFPPPLLPTLPRPGQTRPSTCSRASTRSRSRRARGTPHRALSCNASFTPPCPFPTPILHAHPLAPVHSPAAPAHPLASTQDLRGPADYAGPAGPGQVVAGWP
jgi:hypothetical protein